MGATYVTNNSQLESLTSLGSYVKNLHDKQAKRKRQIGNSLHAQMQNEASLQACGYSLQGHRHYVEQLNWVLAQSRSKSGMAIAPCSLRCNRTPSATASARRPSAAGSQAWPGPGPCHYPLLGLAAGPKHAGRPPVLRIARDHVDHHAVLVARSPLREGG
jgi:hypothetical protein